MIGKSSRQAWYVLLTVTSILFLGCVNFGARRGIAGCAASFFGDMKEGWKASEKNNPINPQPVRPPVQPPKKDGIQDR